jgi:hypothetical protein
VRPGEHVVEIGDIAAVRDDLGDSFRDRETHSAGVIAVVVRDEQFRDRFVRPQLSRFGEHGANTFVVRRFNQQDVIREFGQQALVRRPLDVPKSLCDLPGGRRRRRWRRRQRG